MPKPELDGLPVIETDESEDRHQSRRPAQSRPTRRHYNCLTRPARYRWRACIKARSPDQARREVVPIRRAEARAL